MLFHVIVVIEDGLLAHQGRNYFDYFGEGWTDVSTVHIVGFVLSDQSEQVAYQALFLKELVDVLSLGSMDECQLVLFSFFRLADQCSEEVKHGITFPEEVGTL